MAKVYLTTGMLQLENDVPLLSYTVVVMGPPHTIESSTYTLDPTLSWDDNIIALWQQAVARVEEKSITIGSADLGGCGIRAVTEEDLDKPIEKSSTRVADADSSQPTIMARMMDSLRSMWS